MSEVPTRLLRDALRDQAAPGSSECIDAATLASWSDGMLSGRERAAAEEHAAGCARCQAIVAAMMRATPHAPARASWRMPFYGWLVPAAAIATAVVVWIGVSAPRRTTKPAAEARAAAAPTPPTPTGKPATDSAAPVASTDTLASALTDQRAAAAAAKPQERLGRGTTAAAAPSATPTREYDAVAKKTEAMTRAEPSAANTTTMSQLRDAAAPPASVPAASAPARPASAAPALAAPPEITTAQAPAPAQRALRAPAAPAAAAAVGSGERASTSGAQNREIVSPDAAFRWRILPAGRVERSVDGGATWQPQPTGVEAALVTGSAPSPKTCWIVGQHGLVLKTIDGQSWHRIAFPEALDLTSVRATDDLRATVTSVDGRTFTTVDGGATWSGPR